MVTALRTRTKQKGGDTVFHLQQFIGTDKPVFKAQDDSHRSIGAADYRVIAGCSLGLKDFPLFLLYY